MADKIYPKDNKKEARIEKQGYNSITLVRETDEAFEFELYNPNVKPEEGVSEK